MLRPGMLRCVALGCGDRLAGPLRSGEDISKIPHGEMGKKLIEEKPDKRYNLGQTPFRPSLDKAPACKNCR